MSSSSSREFYVFLSFQGQEIRRTFVSHLRCSLDRRGIRTLADENGSRGGESDPYVFDRTIEESKVAVVLISENYATSPWCLESLVKILGFHHSGSLDLIPVFYEIGPSDVRKQSGKLREPFSFYEKEHPANVQIWRQALSQLADIPSSLYSDNWRGDAEMIGKITNDIWGMMIGSKSSDLCGLVGMDRHIKAMHSLLDLELNDDRVPQIVICGKECIGKTELAKYLIEEVLHLFEICIWLDAPIRQYISGYLYNNHEYASYLTEKLRRKLQRYEHRDPKPKVLLVVDNVADWYQTYVLLREDLLGPGSKLIITTRHISHTRFSYEVVGLELSEALQLFCLHAFDQTYPSVGFEELSCRALKLLQLTGGSPSTIKKFGTRLSGRDRQEWDVILSGYERLSDKGTTTDSNKINLSEDTSVPVSVSTQLSTISNSNTHMGMDRHMQALYRLLELESDYRVRVLSIWGTQGIGKTTLARYAYGEISQQFHTPVFLENAEDHSLCLEERVLSKAIQREAYTVRNSKDCSDVVKSGLRGQKVLLVVDGVHNSKALEDVWKIASWFGPGSRVIVTTRDESLLLTNGVKHVYEVKCLRFDEALQLFYEFALKKKAPSVRCKQLSVRAIKLVGFLPLALKVTGSMLYGKDDKYWETILQSIEEKQDKSKVEVSAE